MPLNRRKFLHETTAAGASLAALATWSELRAAESPNAKIVVGVMGTNGRGTSLAERFATMPGAEVAYVCDVNQDNVARAASKVTEAGGKTPTAVSDFRRILDDKAVDALVIATPDHWHGPGTILGCTAGKNVYVEKPCCHNPREGELMVAAARKYDRRVQMGTQRRSMPGWIEGVEKVRSGEIGDVIYARARYDSPRPTIGRMKLGTPGTKLDYALWQGPAPEMPYREFPTIANNPFHYHWHWFWHWGTGELGNNGVHMIDVCRWGLGVDYPLSVNSAGGHYRYQDDQETPDTNIVTFDFGDKAICWEGRSWYSKVPDDKTTDLMFFGSKGTLSLSGAGYRIFDTKGKEVAKGTGDGSDKPHVQNFLDAIRSGTKLNQEIEEGYKSTLLCLLGNIAYRTGHTLHLDPQSHQIVNDPQATALWGREYRPGWEPKV